MLHSYYSNNISKDHFKKKKISNTNSNSQIMIRSKTSGNNKESIIRNRKTSPLKNINNEKQRFHSNNKLNKSSINKHIQFKKDASSNYNVNRTMGNIILNKSNSSFNKNIDVNKSVFISQEKDKSNISQSSKDNNKTQKKILTVNTDYSQITNESLGISTINDINIHSNDIDNQQENVKKFKKTLINSGSLINIHNNNKEHPLKLYKDNLISHNNNLSNYQNENNYTKVNTYTNSLANSINFGNTNKNNFNILTRENFSKQIYDINIQLDKKLSENKSISKSQKYNTIKHAFEDLIRLLQNNNSKLNDTNMINLLQKLLFGYHEVVNAYLIENTELKKLNCNLNEKNEKFDKLLIESMSIINEKNRELKFLKKKISTMTLETESTTNHNITSNENEYLNVKAFEKGSVNEKIYNLNKSNLGDLDALYFFDKIEMKHKRSFSQNIPLLKLRKEEDNSKNKILKKNNTNKILHFKHKSQNIINEKNINNNNNDNTTNKKHNSNFKLIKSHFKI